MVEASLRFLLLWRVIGLLLVALVIYESLCQHPVEITLDSGDGYGHGMAYATLMFWFAQLSYRRGARIALAVLLMMLGVGLEFAQRLTEWRTFAVSDMAADAIGVGIGWIAAPPRLPNVLRRVEKCWLNYFTPNPARRPKRSRIPFVRM